MDDKTFDLFKREVDSYKTKSEEEIIAVKDGVDRELVMLNEGFLPMGDSVDRVLRQHIIIHVALDETTGAEFMLQETIKSMSGEKIPVKDNAMAAAYVLLWCVYRYQNKDKEAEAIKGKVTEV
jgi:hypothetical protein